MKRYFLGLAANYSRKAAWKHTFTIGQKNDYKELENYLEKKYGGEAILCKNGRSALALAFKAYFKPGDAILVNGFTCYAVCEAVKAAKLTPVFVDISRENLNFEASELQKKITSKVRGIVVQNSLGNPVDIAAIEKFAKKHHLIIIEDLAHCAGVKYADGRECGTVGAAAALSFGKEKSIDTVSGGAVVLRYSHENAIEAPSKLPRCSDHLRARFYPMLGLICRDLTGIHLGGALMRGLLKIHWVERSADNKLDLERKMSKFEAKLALPQLKQLKKSGEPPIREFFLVNDREETLKELTKNGYYFSGVWYEKPISPARYYKKVRFPEKECPNAVWIADHIVNLPRYYSKQELALARIIISTHEKEGNNG